MSSVIGSGGEFDLEMLRQVILEGLHLLVADSVRVGQIFERHDTYERDRDSPERFGEEMHTVLRDTIESVAVYAHRPEQERQLPLIGIEYVSRGTESGQTLGDVVHESSVQVGSRLYVDRSVGAIRRSAVQVSILAETYDATWGLHQAVADVLFRDKWRLLQSGCMRVDVSDTPPEIDRGEKDIRWSEGRIEISLEHLRRTTKRIGPVASNVILDWGVEA